MDSATQLARSSMQRAYIERIYVPFSGRTTLLRPDTVVTVSAAIPDDTLPVELAALSGPYSVIGDAVAARGIAAAMADAHQVAGSI
jgi:hypothetical protein